jgi:deazaflavin-dependent oxidoreductase (nitroreductase family)
MAAKKPRPFTKGEERIGNVAVKLMSGLNTAVYRLTGGRIGGRFPGGAPVFLVTTVGRKSGQRRTSPLLYLKEGDDYVIVASKAGMSHHPLWYRNMEANPEVEIELGREKFKAHARRASAEEKKALWPKLVAMYSNYDDYQARTERDIPVVILSRKT